MRIRAFAALLFGASLAAGCAVRTQPYRFASPLLGQADVPPAWSGRNPGGRNPGGRNPGDRDPDGRDPDGRSSDSRGDRIADIRNSDNRHSDTRRPEDPYAGSSDHRTAVRVASARAADDVANASEAGGIVWSRLPAPNRMPPSPLEPPLHSLAELRDLVSRRDSRDSWAALFGWLHAGLASSATARELVAWASASTKTIADVATWAHDHGRLVEPRDGIAAGDLLVFDRTDTESAADLIAIAIDRDPRGVVEFMYVSGGAVRRGFVDPRRPSLHRDPSGAVVNTFMRTGKRWPPKGTQYLAGELLARVVRLH